MAFIFRASGAPHLANLTLSAAEAPSIAFNLGKFSSRINV